MGTVAADGVKLHYSRTGSGPNLVLIHGLAANRAFWFPRIAPELAKRFTVIAYDLRGHGYSDMPASGYTSADMATDLYLLLERLGARRAHLVGHSFGGVVALHFASRHPERVETVTLADSGVPAFETSQLEGLMYWGARPQRSWDGGGRRPNGGPALRPRGGGPAGVRWRPQLVERNGLVPFARGRRAGAALDRLIRNTSAVKDAPAVAGLTRSRIRRIREPVLALYGEHSRYGDSLRGLQETLSDCTIRLVPGAGHFYPLTQPLLLVRHVRGFVQERTR